MGTTSSFDTRRRKLRNLREVVDEVTVKIPKLRGKEDKIYRELVREFRLNLRGRTYESLNKRYKQVTGTSLNYVRLPVSSLFNKIRKIDSRLKGRQLKHSIYLVSGEEVSSDLDKFYFILDNKEKIGYEMCESLKEFLVIESYKFDTYKNI